MASAYEEYCDVIALLNERDAMERQRKRHRLPLECYALSENEFFFTICARQHGRPFADAALAQSVVDALLWYKRKYAWHLFCYSLLPDHLHFITRLSDMEMRLRNAGGRGIVPEGILEQVGYFKRYTTTQIWWKLGGRGKLWQRSSYDRVIRYNDSVEDAVFYTLRNPERKGLVETWTDYPYAAIVDEW